MIVFMLDMMHTGDILLALPVITALQSKGYEVGIKISPKFYEPLKFLNLPLFIEKPKQHLMLHQYKKVGRHKTDNWVESLKRHGIHVTPEKRSMLIDSNTDILPDGNWCVLQPWCQSEQKQFSTSDWASIRERAEEKGYKVAVCGPASYHYQATLIGGSNLTGKDEGGWINTVASADLLITVDSGAGHLSDALGKRNIVIFKITDPAEWAPYWNRAGVVTSISEALEKI